MEENKVFNEGWKLQYYLISAKNKMICLSCNSAISTLKKFGAHQHYNTHKDHNYFELDEVHEKLYCATLNSFHNSGHESVMSQWKHQQS